jgi:hypothetical protein
LATSFDKNKSFFHGAMSESAFWRLATEKGFVVAGSTTNQDISQHIDQILTDGVNNYSVDIKAIKRMSRKDADFQDEWVWVELKGVRGKGWLFGGKADLIAFERHSDYVLIKREKLMELVDQLVDREQKVDSAADAKYKVYTRKGRTDLISMIEMDHIIEHCWNIWVKSERSYWHQPS